MKNIAAILTALFLALGATTSAQPGSLDGDFDADGKVTTSFGAGDDSGHSVAIQPDGKIVVAGSAYNGTDHDFALARYNTDGTLDNSFSVDGKVTTAFGIGEDNGWSVAIQPDGKIVVAGYAYNFAVREFAIGRYNTDGTLDNSFSVDGKVTTAFGTGADGWSVAIQPDGRILVAGYAYNGTDYDFALARYNTDGTLDNSFSVDGKVTTSFGTGHDYGRSVVIQPNGKILIAGSAYIGTNGDFAIARYNADGTLDDSFSVDGKVTTAFGTGTDYGQSVALQPDGKIVVAGTLLINGTDYDFALARYNTDGALDNSFSVDGKVTTDFGTVSDQAFSVALQPDGRIVVAGLAYTGSGDDFAVARYLSGLNIGVIEFSIANNAPLIYPNPLDNHATLEYTLQNAETISIHLLDMQGRTVQTFIERRVQPAGEHRQSIDLPEALPSGTYLIAISSPKGKLMVQVVK